MLLSFFFYLAKSFSLRISDYLLDAFSLTNVIFMLRNVKKWYFSTNPTVIFVLMT